MKIKKNSKTVELFNEAEALNEDTLDKEIQKADNTGKPLYVGEGQIESVLDRCLKIALRVKRSGAHEGWVNPLFVGAAGTGKTARIKAWAAANNITLVSKQASSMDSLDLGGAVTPDTTGTVVKRLASTEFDELDFVGDEIEKEEQELKKDLKKELPSQDDVNAYATGIALERSANGVLWLDEYNRAKEDIRGTLLTLIQDHVLPDPRQKSGERYLKNFLFTVSAINPANINYNTQDLDDAEKSRFMVVYVQNDISNTGKWLIRKLTKELENAEAENDAEYAKELTGKIGLVNTLLIEPSANPNAVASLTFDSAEDIEKSHDPSGSGNALLLTARTFTNLINYCDGTKADFLRNWNSFCNKDKYQVAKQLLANYKDPVAHKANDIFKKHELSDFEKLNNFVDSSNLPDK